MDTVRDPRLQAQLDQFLEKSAANAAFYQQAANFVAAQRLLINQEAPQPRRWWRSVSPVRALCFLLARLARRSRRPGKQSSAPVVVEGIVTAAISMPISEANEPNEIVIVINVD